MQNYYKVDKKQITDKKACFDVSLISDCEVYAGHFPNHPRAPGACSIEMIRQCISSLLQREIQFSKIHQCKFISPINPNVHKHLQLTFTNNEDKWIATVVFGEQLLMRLKAEIV